MRLIFIFFCCCLLLIASQACRNNKKGVAIPEADTIIRQNLYNLSNNQYAVAKIYFSKYKGASAAINDSINRHISNYIRRYLMSVFDASHAKGKTTTELAELFVQSYNDIMMEFPEFHLPYKFEVNVQKIYENRKHVCFKVYVFNFTGENHPFDEDRYFNFSKENGQLIRWKEVIPNTELLNEKLERHFRKLRGLTANEALDKKGFYFKDNRFQVNNNFALTRDTLIVHYNGYEIAAWAFGPTTLKLPYSELGSIIDTTFISH